MTTPTLRRPRGRRPLALLLGGVLLVLPVRQPIASAQDPGPTAPAPPVATGQPVTSGGARADDRRALRLEDYYRLKRLGSIAISPDGAWVTYTVTTPVEETNGDLVESWVVGTDGSTFPVAIRHAGDGVTDPGWLEDGRLRYRHGGIVWAVRPGDADGAPQPYEASPRERLESPDGRWAAQTRAAPLPPRAAIAMSEFESRHEERFQGVAFDWYPFLRDGRPFPLTDPRDRIPEEVFLEAADGDGEARQLTALGLEASGLRWAPDGRTLLFSANHAILDELAYGTSDLFVVTLEGEVTRLTDDGHNYAGADFSPDGRWIAYVRSLGTDLVVAQGLDHGGHQDLYVLPTGGGQAVNLTADWDLDAGTPRWSPDSRHLYFTAGIGGATHLFRVAVTGGAVEQVTSGERRIEGLAIARDFRRMAYAVAEFDRPADVWVADIDGRNERRLTDLHGEFLATIEIATHPTQTIHWTSYDGTPVEGFLIYPHGYEPARGRYPLIVMNHGGPHSASGYGFNFKNHLFAAHGYFVFLPNFRASTGYGADFKWATWGAWGDKDGEDVLSGVDHLVEHHGVDRERVGTTGHSYGGILTNWLITRYPGRFRAAVSGAGESNWTSNYALSDVARTKDTEFFGPPWEPRSREIMVRQSPALNCAGVQAPTLFVHGAEDYRVPVSGALQLYTCLKRQGVAARVIIYDGMAHSIGGHWNNVHRMIHELRWWEAHLKPESLPRPEAESGSAPIHDDRQQ
jgi:dipeptidyl aminopeptidase/acylaminoacyl peptidase